MNGSILNRSFIINGQFFEVEGSNDPATGDAQMFCVNPQRGLGLVFSAPPGSHIEVLEDALKRLAFDGDIDHFTAGIPPDQWDEI